jgi:small subunit ribosomal protein S1
MATDPWEGDIPGRYHPGDVKTGKVTKVTNFGVFIELEQGLEGLLHVSELSEGKVDSVEEVVKVGDELEVKVLRVDSKDRKIGLSRKNLHGGVTEEELAALDARPQPPVEDEPQDQGESKGPSKTLRGGTGAAGPLIQMPGS